MVKSHSISPPRFAAAPVGNNRWSSFISGQINNIKFIGISLLPRALWMLLVCMMLMLAGCVVDRNIGLPAFGPDNTVVFAYFAMDYSKLATYNLTTGEVHKLDTPGIKHSYYPQYSRDGKKILFAGSNDDLNSYRSDFFTLSKDFYMMNEDGMGLKQLSHFPDDELIYEKDKVIIRPSLSPDGRRIIYSVHTVLRVPSEYGQMHIGSGKMVRRGKTTATTICEQIFEYDIGSGVERRLFDDVFFAIMTFPYYLSDGKRFVFSGEYPLIKIQDAENRKYKPKYKDNTIFIMDGLGNVISSHLMRGMYSHVCSVAHDDTILFVSQTNELDGKSVFPYIYDLFLMKKDGSVQRVTKLDSDIISGAISPDGSRIMFRKNNWTLWMINADGSDLQQIVIPTGKLRK